MSTATPPAGPDVPGLEHAPPRPPRRRRHALGLPAGSIRALLTALVFGLLAVLLLTDQQGTVPMLYNYLWYLLLLIVAHYFAAHGNTIGAGFADERNPWGLPRGTFRIIIVVGFLALVAYLYHKELLFEAPPVGSSGHPLVLLAGFFLGAFVTRLVRWLTRRPDPPAWFQDVQAWLALIAILMLAVQLIVMVFIDPRLQERRLQMPAWWEGVFAAIVGFYFGARS